MSRSSFAAVIGTGWDLLTGDQLDRRNGVTVAARGRRAALATRPGAALAIVGRLDNPLDLANSLGIGGRLPHEGPTVAAARILLAAWDRWGLSFLDRAIGSYSGAIADHDRGALHVFRDLTAGDAAYVAETPLQAVAGSDFEEVARLAVETPRISKLFVASYLQRMVVDATNTPYEGVSAVLPGYVATISGGKSMQWRQSRYAQWHVSLIRHQSFNDILDEFTEIFDAAVGCRIEGEEKIGVALSGGLDSTNVLASIVQVAPEAQVCAYAIPFYSANGDERERQRQVAAHCGVPLMWVSVRGRGPLGQWTNRLFAGRPMPPIGGNWYFTETLCERAEADDTRVLYDGEDADSLLTGNRSYMADLLVTLRLRSWLTEARRIQSREGTSIERLLRYSIYKQIPSELLALFGRRPMVARPSPLIAKSLARASGLERKLHRLPAVRVWSPGHKFARYLRLAGDPLHVGAFVADLDIAARDRDVTLAHPFYDRRLMTYCMGLPWSAICGDSTPKRLLRELAKRRLPPSLHRGATKARLDEYYDSAVFSHEKELVLRGLELAQERPDWFDVDAVLNLREDVELSRESFVPSRAAMLMLWAQEVEVDGIQLAV